MKTKSKAKKPGASEKKYRQYRWALRQKTRGRCARCSQKLSNRSKSLCDRHLISERTRMRIKLGYPAAHAAKRGKMKPGRKRLGETDLRVKPPGKRTPRKSRKAVPAIN